MNGFTQNLSNLPPGCSTGDIERAAGGPDIRITTDSSITLIMPLSDYGRDWCADHLPDDCPMLGMAYAVENNYAGAILDGMAEDGLEMTR